MGSASGCVPDPNFRHSNLKVSNVTHVNEESNKVVHMVWEILLKFGSFFVTLLSPEKNSLSV